jgi:glycine betaine transporter
LRIGSAGIFNCRQWGILIVVSQTSADSAILVLGILSSNGNLNPSNWKKFTWGVLMSGLSFCVVRAGGLDLVKNISIIGAFPFLILLLFSIISLLRFLSLDRSVVRRKKIGRIIYKDKNITDIENI